MEIFAGIKLAGIFATIVYSLLGLFLLILSYVIVDRLTHFSLHEEVAEKQNIAVAIVIAAILIAIAIIIAAVITS